MPVLTNQTRLFRGVHEYSAAHRDDEDWPVEEAFDANVISGLKIWLDAADYHAYSEMTDGPSWPNKATGGVSTGFVGSPPPALSTNTKNGLPLVRFTTSEGRVRTTSTGVHLEWTVVYVSRMVGPTPGRILNSIYPTGGNLLIGFWNYNQDVFYDNGFATNSYVGWTTNWKMYSADGTATGTASRYYSNGTLLGTGSTGAGWGNCFAISGYDPSTAAESCDCEVAEVLQWNRKLADEERQEVEGYLREKYGLPTP